MLEECPYAAEYRSDLAWTRTLARWVHSYNHHRSHSALAGRAPIARSKTSRRIQLEAWGCACCAGGLQCGSVRILLHVAVHSADSAAEGCSCIRLGRFKSPLSSAPARPWAQSTEHSSLRRRVSRLRRLGLLLRSPISRLPHHPVRLQHAAGSWAQGRPGRSQEGAAATPGSEPVDTPSDVPFAAQAETLGLTSKCRQVPHGRCHRRWLRAIHPPALTCYRSMNRSGYVPRLRCQMLYIALARG